MTGKQEEGDATERDAAMRPNPSTLCVKICRQMPFTPFCLCPSRAAMTSSSEPSGTPNEVK